MSEKRPGSAIAKLLLFLFVVGGVSTGLWLGTLQFPAFRERLLSWQTLVGLSACVALTTVNLAARWLRWHFLIRRFTQHLPTRDSLLVYFATLPAILTPFCVGELLRVFLLRKGAPKAAGHLAWVWIIERMMDAFVLLSFLMVAQSTVPAYGAIAALAVVCFFLLRYLLTRRGADMGSALGVGAMLITAGAWMLPVGALVTILSLFQSGGVAGALTAFSSGTLLGGLTGLPLGVFVTGTAMIHELVRSGVAQDVAVLSILIFRIGTAWYAVLLGVAIFLFWKRRLGAIVRNVSDPHFDALAPEYVGEIPDHIRERLLMKKVTLIETRLDQSQIRPGARGLDLGCGQGWYLGELVKAGYEMVGADYSGGQVAQGRAHLTRQGLTARLIQADAQSLPFSGDTFDFAYSINAFHHILSAEARARAFAEVARVLRPGGVFLFHEINTVNPVFRFYMGYVFPLLRRIDQGDEQWILPTRLPEVPGCVWQERVDYFTFIPDFVPAPVYKLLWRLERHLEQSGARRFSAHYQAVLTKAPIGQGDRSR